MDAPVRFVVRREWEWGLCIPQMAICTPYSA